MFRVSRYNVPMPTISVQLPAAAAPAYEVRIAPNLLADLGSLVHSVAPAPSAAIISDDHVARHYLTAARMSLQTAGYRVIEFVFPSGESSKTLATASTAFERLLAVKGGGGVERATPIIALGGGVVGDLAGFVSATILRGTPFIQCPTTLLAAVDASVGGKVGVDHAVGKNLIGAFHQPRMVITDIATFQTLPAREIRCGLAECIKHAIIRDASLFTFISDNLPAILAPKPSLPILTELVARNVQIKADVVMLDPFEKSLRALLNLGHTTAHALETITGYGTKSSALNPQHSVHSTSLQHGEAVALGMVVAARLAVSLNKLPASTAAEITSLIARAGLPTHFPNLDINATLSVMATDKKVTNGQLLFILPTSIGTAEKVAAIDPALIRAAVASLAQPRPAHS